MHVASCGMAARCLQPKTTIDQSSFWRNVIWQTHSLEAAFGLNTKLDWDGFWKRLFGGNIVGLLPEKSRSCSHKLLCPCTHHGHPTHAPLAIYPTHLPYTPFVTCHVHSLRATFTMTYARSSVPNVQPHGPCYLACTVVLVL